MNKIVISIGAVVIVILIVVGVVAYMERTPSQSNSSSLAQNGFQPLNRGGVNSPSVPTPGQAQPIPYATPAPQPTQQEYQQTIVTSQPANFSEPFIQYTQPSQPAPQQAVTEPSPTYTPPVVAAETSPVQTPIQTPVATSVPLTIPNLASYIPYSGPAAPAVNVPASGGGGGGGSSGITSILVSVGVGLLAYLVGGPILGALLGEGISALFGGGGGGGGGGVGSILGIGGGGGSGNFGGKITNVTFCECTVNLMLDIDDVRGQSLSLIFSPGSSKLYEDYNVFTSGPEVLGTYSQSGGQCEVYSGEECQSEGSPDGTINIIGTSE